MRLSFTAAAAVVALAFVALVACTPRGADAPASDASQKAVVSSNVTPAATQAQPGDSVRRITQDELRADLDKGTIALYDVRDPKSYEAGHIKGAKLVPFSEVEKRLDQFPKDKLVVTYCA